MAKEPGRTRYLLINWKPSGKWADVAAGQSDAQIDRLAAHITSTFTSKFFLAIYHEPENNVQDTAGSGMRASDYRAMFRHVVQRLREKGVTNAVTVMNYMGAVKWGVTPWFGDLYPGDDVVDWVAFDPYSVGQPGFNAGDFAKMVNRGQNDKWPGMYDYVVKNHPGKPVMLGEWGFGDFSADRSAKVQFFTDMAAQLAHFPAIKALVYFDAADAAPFGDTRIDSSQQSLTAFKKLAGDPGIARAPAPTPKAGQ
jgi:beta-mannanase